LHASFRQYYIRLWLWWTSAWGNGLVPFRKTRCSQLNAIRYMYTTRCIVMLYQLLVVADGLNIQKYSSIFYLAVLFYQFQLIQNLFQCIACLIRWGNFLTDKIDFCGLGLAEIFCFPTNERLGQDVEMYKIVKYFTERLSSYDFLMRNFGPIISVLLLSWQCYTSYLHIHLNGNNFSSFIMIGWLLTIY
jgi:hypothetical protein